MTEVTHGVETTHRLVYAVPNPTVWSEVSKALYMIEADLMERGIDTNWDDAVRVEADDMSIRFVADLPNPPPDPKYCNRGPCVLEYGHEGGCRT
jgi:hypothetical protein